MFICVIFSILIKVCVSKQEQEKQEFYHSILMVIKLIKVLKVLENGIGNFKNGIQWVIKHQELLQDGYSGANKNVEGERFMNENLHKALSLYCNTEIENLKKTNPILSCKI